MRRLWISTLLIASLGCGQNAAVREGANGRPRAVSARQSDALTPLIASREPVAATPAPAAHPMGGPVAAKLASGALPPAADDTLASPATEAVGTEDYKALVDNPFRPVIGDERFSTFSIDVDTASYSNVRRYLLAQHQLPPVDAVRIEELINYFHYDYPEPQGDVPFSVTIETARCPWEADHRLARVGLKGRGITNRPVSNLVFLIDASGSMQDANKLSLVKAGLKLLVDGLTENDRVAIVAYAGASGLVLDSTTGDRKAEILAALENLQAGGSTNGGAGIELAYRVATEHMVPKGVNRVILCTDGDFNVGLRHDQLEPFIVEKARSGVFLTTLGFGTGNYKDSTLEMLADKGNGNYAYIDTLNEARKVFVDQIQATLVTIAKDVKLQLEFDPALVASYRLIGYENRVLNKEDFDDDAKDAGEIGAGHTVTALYELVLTERSRAASETGHQLFSLKMRYKAPDGETSSLIETSATDRGLEFSRASEDFKWAASVAGFGMLLRNSPYRGNLSWPAVSELAQSSQGNDRFGYRNEFRQLIDAAQRIPAAAAPQIGRRD